MTRVKERTDSEIHPLYNWAIMSRAKERTDSEIYPLYHWAIMTRATERTDSEIYPLYNWAIMTRATERTDSEIHPLYHWASMPDSRSSYEESYELFYPDIPHLRGVLNSLYTALAAFENTFDNHVPRVAISRRHFSRDLIHIIHYIRNLSHEQTILQLRYAITGENKFMNGFFVQWAHCLSKRHTVLH